MGQIITCEVNGVSVLLDVEPEAQEGETRNHEQWRADTYPTKEPDTLAWIDAFCRPGDVIYDVGANIGQYALYAAKRLRGDCRVFAFEPEALNYAKLNRNIVLNGLSETVTACCLALADRTALDFFYVRAFAPGASLHTFGRPVTQGEKPFPPRNRQGTMGVSLDDLTGRFALPFPAHVKIDVDGIEERIVQGADRTLDDPRLRSVLIEVFMHGDVAHRIREAFLRKDFVLHNADVLDDTPGIVQNLIFRRPS